MPDVVRVQLADDDTQALQVIDKLCDRPKLLVKEEFALLAMRMNMHFHSCARISEVERLADTVYAHNPSVFAALLDDVTEGDACVHISLELLVHLAQSTAAAAELVRLDVLTTLISIFPVLPGVAQLSALQLLDHLTLNAQHLRPLCRVTCVRVLWDVLSASNSVSIECLTLTLSLLDKITDRIVTAMAVDTGSWRAAAHQIVLHTAQRAPQLLSILETLSSSDGSGRGINKAAVAAAHTPHTEAHHGGHAVVTMAARIGPRVHRWRVSMGSISTQKTHPPTVQSPAKL